jgi:hypothetical protein
MMRIALIRGFELSYVGIQLQTPPVEYNCLILNELNALSER